MLALGFSSVLFQYNLRPCPSGDITKTYTNGGGFGSHTNYHDAFRQRAYQEAARLRGAGAADRENLNYNPNLFTAAGN
jgi:hypothetical protein